MINVDKNKLLKFNISFDRWNKESKQLFDSGFKEDEISKLILRKSSEKTIKSIF